MPKFFITSNNIEKNIIRIEGKDVNHIKNVLRAEIHEKIEVCNQEDFITYLCSIEKLENEYIECKIISKIENEIEKNISITIFQGLPKSDKMEYIIQKSVELGVYDIYPVEMKRCIVKLQDKDKSKKILRWQNISEVAAKQSGRNLIPKINNVININNICEMYNNYDLLLVAYENETDNYIKNELLKFKKLISNSKEIKEYKIGILVGPEGGLEEKEIELLNSKGIHSISLGKRILRTETVALNVISNIVYELEI